MSKRVMRCSRQLLRGSIVVLVLASLLLADGAALAVPAQLSPGTDDVSAEERASAAPLASEEAPNVAQNDPHGDFSDEPPTASGLAEASKSVAVDAKDSKYAGEEQPGTAPVAVPRDGCRAPLTSAAPAADRQVVADPSNDSCPKTKQGSGFVKDESRVIDDLTTPTEKVFANPDGSRTSKLSTAPVRFQDTKGDWHEIDLDLEAKNGALATKSAQFPLTLLTDPAKGLAELSTPAGAFVLKSEELANEVGAPKAKGRSGEFAATSDGRSVRVTALSTGFEQDTILTDGDAPATYGLEFTMPAGVTARQGEHGVEFADDKGALLATFGGGVAYDSKIN